MFLSELQVVHVDGKRWRLKEPLIYEGRWQYYVIREGFVTDFASIPRPVQWLLDNAGRNSEAAVLHDAVWRESKRKAGARVDPWNADGLFRRSLRQTGAPALTRGLMWFAVRLAAMARRRFGREGPSLGIKIVQLLGILLLGLLTAAGPTLVAIAGLLVYWIGSWVVALVWWFFDRYKLKEPTNWPWPGGRRQRAKEPPDYDLLMVIDKPGAPGITDSEATMGRRLEALLAERQNPTGPEIDLAFGAP